MIGHGLHMLVYTFSRKCRQYYSSIESLQPTQAAPTLDCLCVLKYCEDLPTLMNTHCLDRAAAHAMAGYNRNVGKPHASQCTD